MCWTGHCIWTKAPPISTNVMCSTARTSTARWRPSRKRHWKHWLRPARPGQTPQPPPTTARSPLMPPAERCCLRSPSGMVWNWRKKRSMATANIWKSRTSSLPSKRSSLRPKQNKLDELTLKVNDMETLIDEVSAAAYDKAVEVVTDVVRTETRKEDMRMIEDTKKWVLSPERKAPQATRNMPPTVWTPCWTSSSRPCRPPLPLAGETPEAGGSAERQGTGQGESTGFRSATVEPFAGRTGAAESICTFNCGKVRKSFSIVRGDVY